MKLKFLLLSCVACLSGCACMTSNCTDANCTVESCPALEPKHKKQTVCTGSVVKGCQPVIYFDVNKADLKEEGIQNLNWVVKKMNRYDRYHVSLTGHADVSGTEQRNLKLSQDRATVVREYLLKHNISPERIRFDFRGSTEPICEEEYCKELSRRVNVDIYVNKSNGLKTFFDRDREGRPAEIIISDLKK